MTVDEAAGVLSEEGGGMISSRRYSVNAVTPTIANIKVLEAGSLQLASAPLDENGQLRVRDLQDGEQPGLTVRRLFAAAS